MGGRMVLTPDQLVNTAEFLRTLTNATKEFGVQLSPYGPSELSIGDTTIGFVWDGEQYVLDDQVGT